MKRLAEIQFVLEDRSGAFAADEGSRDVVEVGQTEFSGELGQMADPLDVAFQGFAVRSLVESDVTRRVQDDGPPGADPGPVLRGQSEAGFVQVPDEDRGPREANSELDAPECHQFLDTLVHRGRP